MRLDGMYIAGVGVCLPRVLDTREAARRGVPGAAEAADSGWTGVAVAGERPAPEMAAEAAQTALARSGHRSADVAVVMYACILPHGPEGWPPHTYVQRRVVGGTVPSMEIRQQCSGMLGGMEFAACFLSARDRTAALVTGADNFGPPMFDRWRYAAGAGTNRASISGDAGAAVLLSRRGGFARLRAAGSMTVPWLEELFRSGIPLFPPEPALGRPPDVGARFADYRRREPAAFDAAKEALSRARTELARRTLAEAEVPASRVTRVAHVFTGARPYVESVLGPLGIDPARGMLDFGRRLGHLGTCDPVVALDHLVTTGAAGPGDHVLMLSNGAATLACAVAEIVEPPAWLEAA
ncbi:3-oxoacyl-[acyl-carrier-protein] synthase III C-terminal domain-containing protein [Sphaerisporangium sp. B11E5]|uniref:3-oxoacyl-[acyl-carrier-protein] synthase III C-terminal domain-containing protein n=1 Tax=Sphaerisporangium sp. B11E5 TaxID=3153563 RepID=UPI00325DEFC0